MELEKIKFRHSVCKFWVLASVTLGMFVAGLIIPPRGVIDGSVLKAGCIILGMYTVGQTQLTLTLGNTLKAKLTD